MVLFLLSLASILSAASARADEPSEIIPRSGLALPPVGRAGRTAVRMDPVLAKIVAGEWKAPKVGEELAGTEGPSRKWREITLDEKGEVRREGGPLGYAYIPVESKTERTMILEASGHDMAYVNGEPRVGDPYGYGYVRLPVRLKAGTNDLLFAPGRSGPRVKLVSPRATVQLDASDLTAPDLIVGQGVKTWAALVLLNNSDHPFAGCQLRAAVAGSDSVSTPLPAIPPFGTRKVAFRLEGPAPDAEGKREVAIEVMGQGGESIDRLSISLNVLRPEQTHKRTFVSEIDGSVQYYGFVPMKGDAAKPGLILTLHGASVEGSGQAAVYAPKTWAHVVAPTNRRPYGFDWEDWGRLDAIEVLDLASKELGADPRRTYLTGHSMGGHGTWIVGATFPNRFAAIAPSAGWVSMVSYAGARRVENPSPVAALLQRATSPSDTLALAPNLAEGGVYILHGDADDNVPVDQARQMRKVLGEFHPDFAYYERPGAGHWWGNECCDWPPLIDYLSRHERPKPADIRRVRFRTASPGVSSRCDWATIEGQTKALAISAIDLRHDPEKRRFSGTTDNVARLSLDLAYLPPGKAVSVELDGQKLDDLSWPDGTPRLWLERDGMTWKAISAPSPALKGPHRYGPFKDAFRHRVQFVYGTRGTAEENAWSLAKARYDAEAFWYRGNGSIDVVPDTAFDPKAEPDRNVILYGNADTNATWASLVGDGPVVVKGGSVRVEGREVEGKALAVLCIRPRPGSNTASVGLVGGTGPEGMRLTDRLPYFVSGVGYPDFLLLGPDPATKSPAALKAAGYFGADWGVSSGEFAWE